MKSINEMMGVSSAAGIGAPPPGVDPSSAEAKKFAEPGGKAHVLTKPPLKRKTLTFKEWIEEESKHDVRTAAGKMMGIKKVPVRHPGGKVTMEYPGKSSSSGGGE